MINSLKLTLVAAMTFLSAHAISAQQLFSAGIPDNLFTIGLRAGLNTSNQNVDHNVFNSWNVNSWGTGFELGAVVNINLRNFFTLQPGFFYESRSGNYAYDTVIVDSFEADGTPLTYDLTQLGHYRNYHFTIPVIAQLRMGLLPGAIWSVDVGPYFSWLIHSKHQEDVYYQPIAIGNYAAPLERAHRRRYDFGLKIGTGINFLTHFYLGVHYKAGTMDVWDAEALGGRNKTWNITAGYDF